MSTWRLKEAYSCYFISESGKTLRMDYAAFGAPVITFRRVGSQILTHMNHPPSPATLREFFIRRRTRLMDFQTYEFFIASIPSGYWKDIESL